MRVHAHHVYLSGVLSGGLVGFFSAISAFAMVQRITAASGDMVPLVLEVTIAGAALGAVVASIVHAFGAHHDR